MKSYKITREGLKKIHEVACDTWQRKIGIIANKTIGLYENEGQLSHAAVKEMFDAACKHNGVDQKEVLRSVFPDFEEKEDWKNWTTLEQVCKQAGEDIDDYDYLAAITRRERGTILFNILQLIFEVFREGNDLDYSNTNQRKYYIWGEKTASGWSLDGVHFVRTDTDVGARLSVDSHDKAMHIWEHFKEYLIEYWEGK